MSPESKLTALMVLCGVLTPLAAKAGPPREGGLAAPLSNEEAWKRLPRAVTGEGRPLPVWSRMLAGELPRSTAAFLQLDLAQRTKSPVDPRLRAAMRWVAAHADRCAYAEAYAAADALRAGVDDAKIAALSREGYPGWSDAERAALDFARKMTLDSDSVTDAEFARLVKDFGDRRVASMVLLMAYSNFQDRILICLGAEVEPGGPLPPVDVAFDPSALTIRTTPPPASGQRSPLPKPAGNDLITDDPEWTAATYDTLQDRLEAQRRKPTRLRIPEWDEFASGLPAGLFRGSSDIIWYRIVFGYAPELAVPFEYFMRTAGSESVGKYDRIFGQGLFWVTTKAVKCPYCMGHCEMNWEVAGLSRGEIAERSRLLAGDDWSSFPPAEQRAFAFARKLTRAPGSISDEDIAALKRDFGPDRAVIVALNACRYHYMVRISNGFQLKLERENVFYDYYNTKALRPGAALTDGPMPIVRGRRSGNRPAPIRLSARGHADHDPIAIFGVPALADDAGEVASAALDRGRRPRRRRPMSPKCSRCSGRSSTRSRSARASAGSIRARCGEAGPGSPTDTTRTGTARSFPGSSPAPRSSSIAWIATAMGPSSPTTSTGRSDRRSSGRRRHRPRNSAGSTPTRTAGSAARSGRPSTTAPIKRRGT